MYISVFIAHKLRSALTPARGVQALSGEGEAGPERGGPLRAQGPQPSQPAPASVGGVRHWGLIRSDAVQTEGAASTATASTQVASNTRLVIPRGEQRAEATCPRCQDDGRQEPEPQLLSTAQGACPGVLVVPSGGCSLTSELWSQGRSDPQFLCPATSSSFQPLEFLPNL